MIARRGAVVLGLAAVLAAQSGPPPADAVAAAERRLAGLAGEPPDHPVVVRARLELAEALLARGELERALAVGRALLDTVDSSRGAVSGKPRSPRKPIEVAGRDPEPLAYTVRWTLAMVYLWLGDARHAAGHERQMLESARRRYGPGDLQTLQAEAELGMCYRELGRPEQAIELLTHAAAALERRLGPDADATLLARSDLAVSRFVLGGVTSDIEATLHDVLARLRAKYPERHPWVLSAKLNLANALADSGDAATATELLESVVTARREALPPDHPRLRSAQRYLAAALVRRGDPARGLELLRGVLASCERTVGAGCIETEMVRLELAEQRAAAGDLTAALPAHRDALQALEKVCEASDPRLNRARDGYAVLLSEAGRLEEALALQRQVVTERAARLPAGHRAVLLARSNLAVTLVRMGRWREAREIFEEVVQALEEHGDPDDLYLATVRSNLAATCHGPFLMERARRELKVVLRVFEKLLPSDHPDLLQARYNLLLLLRFVGHRDEAAGEMLKMVAGLLARLRTGPVLSPRATREALGGLSNEVACLLSRNRATPAMKARLDAAVFELLETMRACATTPAPRLEDASEALRSARYRVLRARGRLNDLVARQRQGGAVPCRPADVVAAARERDDAEAELLTALRENGTAAPRISVAALAAALPRDAVAVGFREFRAQDLSLLVSSSPRRLVAFVVDAGGELRRLDLGRAEAIDAAVAHWRAAIGEPLPDGGAFDGTRTDAEAELRRLVLEPVLAAAGEAKRLFVCLDGALQLVPLQALALEAGELLGDRYQVYCEPSFARLVAPPPPLASEPALLALGAIDYDRGGAAAREASAGRLRAAPTGAAFRPLGATRGEVEAIGTLFEKAFGRAPHLVFGARADKATLYRQAPGARFLHLATHGYSAAGDVLVSEGDRRTTLSLADAVRRFSPMALCGLALAGANRGMLDDGRVPGILTAEELAGLDLRACELAVLSACDTRVGLRRAGQGVLSLQAALHAAGARATLTALWKVPDRATRTFMQAFYRALWDRHAGKAEALRFAQRALRAEHAPPRVWAAWVLGGDPR